MPQSDITAIVAAVEARAWYPAIAGAITLLLVLLRRVAPETWARLPRRWQWVPAVVLAALAAFADAATSGVTWRVALALTAYSVLSAGMTAIGLHHAAKRVVEGGPDATVPVGVEPSPAAPDTPSTLRSGAVGLVFMALGMLTVLSLTGCAGTFEESRLARVPSTIAAAPTPADVAYCRGLDSSRTTWGAVAKGSRGKTVCQAISLDVAKFLGAFRGVSGSGQQ